MRKIVCRVLKHRLRVVQEFTPESRRVKCMRCDGDWAMNDFLGLIVEWDPDFEQVYRVLGVEILEPLPAWRSLPLEPLTWSELARAYRWPGIVAITVSSIVGHIIAAAGIGYLAVLVTSAITWAIARLLGQRAIERACERKCNSLQA